MPTKPGLMFLMNLLMSKELAERNWSRPRRTRLFQLMFYPKTCLFIKLVSLPKIWSKGHVKMISEVWTKLLLKVTHPITAMLLNRTPMLCSQVIVLRHFCQTPTPPTVTWFQKSTSTDAKQKSMLQSDRSRPTCSCARHS